MRWILLALVPIASAIAVFYDDVPAPPPPESRPPLAFKRYAAITGRVPSQPVTKAVFPFANRSAETIRVVDITPSCGCLRVGVQTGSDKQPRQAPVEIRPGETGRIGVDFETAQESPGPHSYSIEVTTDDGSGQHRQSLTYQVILPERKVTVSPVPLLFYQANEEEIEQVLTVFDSRARPLLVTGVEAESEYLTFDIKTLPDGKTTEITVRVSGKLPREQKRTSITVLTNDDRTEGYAEIDVPVVLSGLNLRSGE